MPFLRIRLPRVRQANHHIESHADSIHFAPCEAGNTTERVVGSRPCLIYCIFDLGPSGEAGTAFESSTTTTRRPP